MKLTIEGDFELIKDWGGFVIEWRIWGNSEWVELKQLGIDLTEKVFFVENFEADMNWWTLGDTVQAALWDHLPKW